MELTWTTTLLAAATLFVLALLMSWVLGWANRAFHVEVDPRIEAVEAALPGANCGGCGYVGCLQYAEAVVRGEAPLNKCNVGGASVAQSLGEILGVEVKQTWPYRPVVHCAATTQQRLQRTEYRGEPTCAAANVVSGVQGCTYGCLGLGDCERACDYDAIHIVDGLAVVDYEKCTGCAACSTACPRNIISMAPFKSERVLAVACSNQDFGADVKAVCKVGCIGCKLCAKMSDHLAMSDNLPVVDYDQYDPTEDFQPVIEKCPMESLVWIGNPSEEERAATTDEEAPERLEADFETTVDATLWRG